MVVSPKLFLKDKDQKQQQMESLEIEMRLTQSLKNLVVVAIIQPRYRSRIQKSLVLV